MTVLAEDPAPPGATSTPRPDGETARREVARLQAIKAAKERSRQARAGNERGLYLLFTGRGKGKTSSAMNLVYRHLARDWPVAVVQFVKNRQAFPDGDRLLLERLAAAGWPVQIHTLGGGFTWETQDPEGDRALAQAAWDHAARLIADPELPLVVLDELHIALHRGQLSLDPVLAAIGDRPAPCHVASTGRYAPPELIAIADLVTEMTPIKHPITAGIPAQAGIEF